MAEKMMTAAAVAEYMGFDVQTIYRKAQRGEIPCHRAGVSVRFKKSEIDKETKGGKDDTKSETRSRASYLADQF